MVVIADIDAPTGSGMYWAIGFVVYVFFMIIGFIIWARQEGKRNAKNN